MLCLWQHDSQYGVLRTGQLHANSPWSAVFMSSNDAACRHELPRCATNFGVRSGFRSGAFVPWLLRAQDSRTDISRFGLSKPAFVIHRASCVGLNRHVRLNYCCLLTGRGCSNECSNLCSMSTRCYPYGANQYRIRTELHVLVPSRNKHDHKHSLRTHVRVAEQTCADSLNPMGDGGCIW